MWTVINADTQILTDTHKLTVFQHVQCLPPLCCWHESVPRRDGGVRCIGLLPLLLLLPLALALLQTGAQEQTHTHVCSKVAGAVGCTSVLDDDASVFNTILKYRMTRCL